MTRKYIAHILWIAPICTADNIVMFIFEESNINKITNFQVLDFSNLNNFSLVSFKAILYLQSFLLGSTVVAPYSPQEV